MQKNIAAYTISNNHSDNMVVSPLVIGYSRVVEFYRQYRNLPKDERAFLVCDIFMYDSIAEALEDHLDSVSREQSLNKNVEEVEEDNSPKVVGKIELPEDSLIDKDCCDQCGRETDSRWGDSRHVLRVRDQVYGTWSEELICDFCYYANIENSLK